MVRVQFLAGAVLVAVSCMAMSANAQCGSASYAPAYSQGYAQSYTPMQNYSPVSYNTGNVQSYAAPSYAGSYGNYSSPVSTGCSNCGGCSSCSGASYSPAPVNTYATTANYGTPVVSGPVRGTFTSGRVLSRVRNVRVLNRDNRGPVSSTNCGCYGY